MKESVLASLMCLIVSACCYLENPRKVSYFCDNKEFLCITHRGEHNYISPSSTLGIQLLLVVYY